MKRDFYEELLQWKSSDRRKPLLLYGARQVGKTYIIKEFGMREYDNLVYVNCYKNNAIKTLFDKDVDVKRIVIGLSALTKERIEPGKTLIFIDEAQEVPSVISSLKYFYENSSQEIDFLVQNVDRIVPIEVKAEVNVKSKSLHAFINIDHKGCNLKGVRFSMLGYVDQGWMENIPLYMVSWYF